MRYWTLEESRVSHEIPAVSLRSRVVPRGLETQWWVPVGWENERSIVKQLLGISRRWHQALNQVWGPSERTALCNCTGCMSAKQPRLPTCSCPTRGQFWTRGVTSALLHCSEGGHTVWALHIKMGGSSQPSNVPVPATSKRPRGMFRVYDELAETQEFLMCLVSGKGRNLSSPQWEVSGSVVNVPLVGVI